MAWQAFKQIESASDLDKLEVHADLDEPEDELADQLKLAKQAAKVLIKGLPSNWENLHVHLGGNADVDPGRVSGSVHVAVTVGKYRGEGE